MIQLKQTMRGFICTWFIETKDSSKHQVLIFHKGHEMDFPPQMCDAIVVLLPTELSISNSKANKDSQGSI